MDEATRGLIIGMVLGDAHVNVRHRYKDGKYLYESSEMRILHSLEQIEYCKHKSRRLNLELGRNSSVSVVKNGPTGKYKAAHFSISHPYFKQVKRWCYPGGKKTFTRRILDMLTPEGIAIWYMDDGHARVNINKHGIVSSVATEIATMCSEAEVNIIVDYFKDVHGLDFKVRRRRGSKEDRAFFVGANTEASRWFAYLVRPYIIPSMLYKLRHVADLESHECRAPIATCACGKNIYDKRYGDICTSCYSKRYSEKAKLRG